MEGNSFAARGTWYYVVLIVGMSLLAGVVVVSILRDAIVNRPQNQVSVMGTGKVTYEPDKAKVTLGVQIDKAPTAEAALNQLTDRVKKITEAVNGLGIPEADVQTSNYSIFPHYDYTPETGSSVVGGYDANQQLVVTINNLKEDKAKVGSVIQAATKVGLNQVMGVTFDVSNVEELKQQARLLALEDAKKKATETSSRVGVKLGKIVGWWDNVVKAPGMDNGYYAEGKGGGGAGSLVPVGDQEIVVETSVNFEIKKGGSVRADKR